MTENWPFPAGLGLVHFFGPTFLLWQCVRVFELRKPFSDASMMAVLLCAPVAAVSIAAIFGIRESNDVAFLGYSLLSLLYAPVILAVMIWVAKTRPGECKMVQNMICRPRHMKLVGFFGSILLYALLELALYFSMYKLADPTPCSSARCHSISLFYGDKLSAAAYLTAGSILVGLIVAGSVFNLIAYFYRFETAPVKR